MDALQPNNDEQQEHIVPAPNDEVVVGILDLLKLVQNAEAVQEDIKLATFHTDGVWSMGTSSN